METRDFFHLAMTHIPEEWRYALLRNESLPEQTEGAAMLADISGFTPMSEALARAFGLRQGAEELFTQINRLFEVLIGIVDIFQGSVISFAGDAITCWFDDYPIGATPTAYGCQRAAACALAMQAAMLTTAKVVIPGEESISLGIKISIATGPVRRFVVGDPAIQWIPVIAGGLLRRMEEGEHLTRSGEVVVDEVTVTRLGDRAIWAEKRETQKGDQVTVLAALVRDVPCSAWPEVILDRDLETLTEGAICPWLLAQVYQRLKDGLGGFLTELRPAVALFLSFSGIDYDQDPQAGCKLDDLVCRVQHELSLSEGTLIQVTLGDKGSYMYVSFGALTAHEDDARRAVEVALNFRDMVQSLDWHGSIQIGISMGTMCTGTYGGHSRFTYAVVGDDVNLAARLMARAQPGEVLISSRVFKAISSDARLKASGLNFEPRAPIRFKGKSEPLPVFAIFGAQSRRAIQFQEPVYTLPMVGRQTELATIEEKMDLVLAGQGQAVGITAEAGLGKSRLIAEASQLARRKGLVGYGGACQSDGLNTAYLVWGPIWRAIFEVNPDAPLRRQIRNLEGMLEELAPARIESLPLLNPILGLSIPDNDFTTGLEPRFRRSNLEALLLDCLSAAVSLAGERGSLFLVLEDLHWIDQASADLLESMIREIPGQRVLILLAYRPVEVNQAKIKALESLPYFTKISLSELSPEETELAIRAKMIQLYPEWQGAVPQKLIQKVIIQAEGNPFYAEELLNYLHDRDIDLHDTQSLETLELPTSLHSLVLSRIDQLASHQQLTLKVASIIGRLFRFDHLQEYYPELGSAEATHRDLEVLARLDLTPVETPEPELSYLFRHIITHEVTYEMLPAVTRMALHELYARYLEEKAGANVIPFVDRLAYHYDHSDNLPKKLEYLNLAGDAAVSRFLNEEAIRYYQRAITLITAQEKPETYQALAAVVGEKLGDILHLITRYAEAREAYQNALACLAVTEIVSRANLTRKIGNAWRDQHDFEGALKVYIEAQQMLGLDEEPDAHIRRGSGTIAETVDADVIAWRCWIQIQMEILETYYWQARVRESEDVIEKISPVVEKYGTPIQRAWFLQSKAAHYLRRDRYYISPEAVDAYSSALEIYQQEGRLASIPASQFQVGFALLFSGHLELAEQMMQSSLQQSTQRGDLSLQARCLTYLTILYRQRKLVEVVESFAERSLRCATTASMPEYIGAAQANQAWVAWQRGDTQTTEELGLAAMALWGQSSGLQSISTPYHWAAVWPLIWVALKANDLEKVVRYIRILLEPVRAHLPDELQVTLEQVSTSWEAGDLTVVRRDLERALALADKYHYL